MVDLFNWIAATLDNLQGMMGQLYNVQLNSTQAQISKDVLYSQHQQLEEWRS